MQVISGVHEKWHHFKYIIVGILAIGSLLFSGTKVLASMEELRKRTGGGEIPGLPKDRRDSEEPIRWSSGIEPDPEDDFFKPSNRRFSRWKAKAIAKAYPWSEDLSHLDPLIRESWRNPFLLDPLSPIERARIGTLIDLRIAEQHLKAVGEPIGRESIARQIRDNMLVGGIVDPFASPKRSGERYGLTFQPVTGGFVVGDPTTPSTGFVFDAGADTDLEKDKKDRTDPEEQKRRAGVMPVDPIKVLEAIAAMLSIGDTLVSQLWRRKKNVEDDGTPSPVTSGHTRDADAIHLHGPDGQREDITIDDVAKLDENSRIFIQAIAESTKKTYQLWAAVYPQRNSSQDPLVNAKSAVQLDELEASLCSDYKKLDQYLAKIHKHLLGYEAIQEVCRG